MTHANQSPSRPPTAALHREQAAELAAHEAVTRAHVAPMRPRPHESKTPTAITTTRMHASGVLTHATRARAAQRLEHIPTRSQARTRAWAVGRPLAHLLLQALLELGQQLEARPAQLVALVVLLHDLLEAFDIDPDESLGRGGAGGRSSQSAGARARSLTALAEQQMKGRAMSANWALCARPARRRRHRERPRGSLRGAWQVAMGQGAVQRGGRITHSPWASWHHLQPAERAI